MVKERLDPVNHNFGHKLINSVTESNGSVIPESGRIRAFGDEHKEDLI